MSRYSSRQKRKKKGQGCFSGCLFGIVGFVGLAVIIRLLTNPDALVNTQPQPAAVASGKLQKALELTTFKLNNSSYAKGLVKSLSVSGKHHVLTIAVNDDWYALEYETRLRYAKNIQFTWSEFAFPDKRDRARISIVDLNGNEVGGSRVVAGSMIWVQDK